MREAAGYGAATSGAAFIDRMARGALVARGADRLAFLHAMLTQEIASLTPGRGCYAAYLTAQGRMIADMRVYELGTWTLIETAAGKAAEVGARLDGFVFSEDVQFTDETNSWGIVRVVGPRAAEVVIDAAFRVAGSREGLPDAAGLAAWDECRAAWVPEDGRGFLAAATREWGLPGFDLFVRAETAGQVRAALAAAGAVALGPEAAEALRIEAGTPEFLVDMTTETIPLEAGIEQRAISFTKGCYPGQEIIIRVLHRGGGRVAKRLVGIVLEGDAIPERGATIAGAGKDIGRVTSAAWSPALGKPVALGMVPSAMSSPGTALVIRAAGGELTAAVAALPLVSRA